MLINLNDEELINFIYPKKENITFSYNDIEIRGLAKTRISGLGLVYFLHPYNNLEFDIPVLRPRCLASGLYVFNINIIPELLQYEVLTPQQALTILYLLADYADKNFDELTALSKMCNENSQRINQDKYNYSNFLYDKKNLKAELRQGKISLKEFETEFNAKKQLADETEFKMEQAFEPFLKVFYRNPSNSQVADRTNFRSYLSEKFDFIM